MSSQNNSSEYCNITETKYDKWRSILPNCTLPTFNETAAGNGTMPSVHQTCMVSGLYPKVNSTECPVTVYPNCTLSNNYSGNLQFPFLKNGTTTEECECTGLNLQNISRSDMFQCTCMHDSTQNITSQVGDSHPNDYAFKKNCTVDSVTNNTILNGMNCTFTDCDYTWENGFFNITHNRTQGDNGTYQGKFIANITDRLSTTTQRTPSTSSAQNASTKAPSPAPTSSNATTLAASPVTPSSSISGQSGCTTTNSTTTTNELASGSESSSVKASAQTMSQSPLTSSESSNRSTVSDSSTVCNTSCLSTTTAGISSKANEASGVTNGSTISALSVVSTTHTSAIGSTHSAQMMSSFTSPQLSQSISNGANNALVAQQNGATSLANSSFGNNAALPMLLLLFYVFAYLGLVQKERIVIKRKYN